MNHQSSAKPGIFGSVKYPLFKESRSKPQFWVYIDRVANHRLDMVEHTNYPRKLRRDRHGLGPLRGTAD